jgi:YVTN family beta-propeller protein
MNPLLCDPRRPLVAARAAKIRPFPLSPGLWILALLALPLTACRPRPFPQYPANYREYAYVTNSGSNTVTAIDVVDVRIDRELAVGQDPVAVAASPTRNEVYVVNSGPPSGAGSLSVIDAEHNQVVAAIPLHRQPVSIDLDAKGDFAYIANSGSRTVSVIDLKARREIAQIPVGEQPDAAIITADGKSLVVADRKGGSVSIIDPATRRVRAVFSGCPGAIDPIVLRDSSKAFVPCSEGHQVMVLGLAHPENRSADSAWEPDRLETLMDVGRAPVNIALKPDGGELFVSNSLSDSISEVVTNSNDVGGAYMMGENPVQGLVSSDNALLFVADLGSQYVTIYSINDGRFVGSLHVGDGPRALAFSANIYLLFAVDSRSGDVAVVRTPSETLLSKPIESLLTLLPTGRDPTAIVDKAFKVP